MAGPNDPAHPTTSARTPRAEERAPCALCGALNPRKRMSRAASLRQSLYEHAQARNPERLEPESEVCKRCLDRERVAFVIDRLEAERGKLSEVEAEIAQKAAHHQIVAESAEEEYESQVTFGQRVADRVARIGGSWPFIAGFFVFLAAWMAWNGLAMGRESFDRYPYILLNLVLSCLAAVQAPIIMMSQNRLTARDRAQADQDFRTNLKAEIEIVALHEKLDHLLHTQYQRLVELQELQLDLLRELANRRRS